MPDLSPTGTRHLIRRGTWHPSLLSARPHRQRLLRRTRRRRRSRVGAGRRGVCPASADASERAAARLFGAGVAAGGDRADARPLRSCRRAAHAGARVGRAGVRARAGAAVPHRPLVVPAARIPFVGGGRDERDVVPLSHAGRSTSVVACARCRPMAACRACRVGAGFPRRAIRRVTCRSCATPTAPLIAGDAFTTTKQESARRGVHAAAEMHGPPMYFTPDWDRRAHVAAAPRRLRADGGHHRPRSADASATLQSELRRLASHFDAWARPAHGRYRDRPAITDAIRRRRPAAAAGEWTHGRAHRARARRGDRPRRSRATSATAPRRERAPSPTARGSANNQ